MVSVSSLRKTISPPNRVDSGSVSSFKQLVPWVSSKGSSVKNDEVSTKKSEATDSDTSSSESSSSPSDDEDDTRADEMMLSFMSSLEDTATLETSDKTNPVSLDSESLSMTDFENISYSLASSVSLSKSMSTAGKSSTVLSSKATDREEEEDDDDEEGAEAEGSSEEEGDDEEQENSVNPKVEKIVETTEENLETMEPKRNKDSTSVVSKDSKANNMNDSSEEKTYMSAPIRRTSKNNELPPRHPDHRRTASTSSGFRKIIKKAPLFSRSQSSLSKASKVSKASTKGSKAPKATTTETKETTVDGQDWLVVAQAESIQDNLMLEADDNGSIDVSVASVEQKKASPRVEEMANQDKDCNADDLVISKSISGEGSKPSKNGSVANVQNASGEGSQLQDSDHLENSWDANNTGLFGFFGRKKATGRSAKQDEVLLSRSVSGDSSAAPMMHKKKPLAEDEVSWKQAVEDETAASISINISKSRDNDAYPDATKDGTENGVLVADDARVQSSKVSGFNEDKEEFSIIENKSMSSRSRISLDIQDPWPNPWSDQETTGMGGQLEEAFHEQVQGTTKETPHNDVVVTSVANLIASAPMMDSSQLDLPVTTAKTAKDENLRIIKVSSYTEDEIAGVIHSQQQILDDMKSLELKGSVHEDNIVVPKDDGSIELLTKAETECEDSWSLPTDQVAFSKMTNEERISLWKRTKKLLKSSKTSNAATETILGDDDVDETEKKSLSRGKKFKLSYLCLLSPCPKKPTSHVSESRGSKKKRPVAKRKNENSSKVSAAKAEMKQEGTQTPDELLTVPDDLITGFMDDPTKSKDEIMDMLDHKESSDDIVEAERDGVNLDVPDLRDEESKDELAALPNYGATNSVLTGRHTNDESLFDDGFKKAQSEFTSFDLAMVDSEAAHQHAASGSVFGSLGRFVSAAQNAVQCNIYEAPVEMVCGCGSSQEETKTSDPYDNPMLSFETKDTASLLTADFSKLNQGEATTKASKRSGNPVITLFRELVDILECSPEQMIPSEPKTMPMSTPAGEEKVEQ